MTLPLRALRIAGCALTLAAATLGLADDAVQIPPRPEQPRNDSTSTREQRRAAYQRWQAAIKAWQDSLTPAQKAELQRRQDLAEKAGREKLERLQRLPLPGDGYRWQDEAAKRHLPAAALVALERDKLAYGPSVKQIFTPYLYGPVFVTSDSVLNAYQVLFEDTFRQLELRRAQTLRGHLEEALAAFHQLSPEQLFPPERFAAAWRHIQRVLGPAIVVLGGAPGQFDPEIRNEIVAAADRIRAADSVSLPDWLGPADPSSLVSIDFRRCKPLSLYAGDPALENYFRAVRWLQLVPLRASRDPELVATVLLGMALTDSKLAGYFDQMAAGVGRPDDPSPVAAWEAYGSRADPRKYQFNGFDAPATRANWAQRLQGYYQINSERRMSDKSPTEFSQFSFRVLPASALPDAELFQRLNDRQASPVGLEVAAWLGSDFASRRLAPAQREALVASQPQPGLFARNAPPTLAQLYLAALRQLFTPPPPAAPAFLRSEAWQAKACETALGGWVQFRHGYALQAKLSVVTFGLYVNPPGFVETNAGFYAAMSRLVDRAHDVFADGGVLAAEGPPDRDGLEDRWRRLKDALFTLETLVGKQLAEQPLTKDEADFLKDYGDTLGSIMGYFASATHYPKDDAPKWAEVNLNPNTDRSLAVALGRPRTLYVLYP
ncbi:MAG TPA: DUF3160 domain-containing protein, partial [Opitutaceae bacterium]|nr:DUF3160 domain-containing protein [Opitutaceae bacterium]